MMCRLRNLPTQMPTSEGPAQHPWLCCHCQDLEAWAVRRKWKQFSLLITHIVTLVGSIKVCGEKETFIGLGGIKVRRERDFYCEKFYNSLCGIYCSWCFGGFAGAGRRSLRIDNRLLNNIQRPRLSAAPPPSV